MTLVNILVFSLFVFLVAWLAPVKWRGWILLVSSVIAIYWMQTEMPVRNLDFWLPSASIALTIFTWVITQSSPKQTITISNASILVIIGVILIIGLTRYFGPLCCITPSLPPQFPQVLSGLVLVIALALLLLFVSRKYSLDMLLILLIIGLFIITKSSVLARGASAELRAINGQDPLLATAQDLSWLGFSYLALRLIHALRDHQAGRLPEYSLMEFVIYVIFFPAFTAGPIDRSQHFIQELRAQTRIDFKRMAWGGQRILIGVFKKFVIADSLALISLNSQNAPQTTSTFWTWILLYAFALRIYFDFSGYTDIAIGLGEFLGIRLPENFSAPYLKTNLTAFWNSWHITLAQWFRSYFFNPFIRALRANPRNIPTWVIILLGQMGTMVLIGLWHGFTLNFIVWGGWHGLGLFIHNRWSEWSRPRSSSLEGRPRARRALALGGWFITFNYVSLGWVWFALPTLSDSMTVFHKLFGV
jgi:alginate O-acetyltransferase complex protein AlgI